MKMVARHVQRLRVLWRPKPDERARKVAEFEFRLNCRRLDERHAFFRFAHGAGVDVVKMAIDPQRVEDIVRVPQAVELRSQFTEHSKLLEVEM